MPAPSLHPGLQDDKPDSVDIDRALRKKAATLVANGLDATPHELLATAYRGYKCWAHERRLHFPEPRRYALLLDILQYCSDEYLVERASCEEPGFANAEVAEMLDARYPRFARLRLRMKQRR